LQLQTETPTPDLETATPELETPKEEVETPASEVETPTEEVETPTEEVETPTEEVETPTEYVETPTEYVETPTPPLIPALCICQTSRCIAKKGLICNSYINKVFDASSSSIPYIYIDKGLDFTVDLEHFSSNITIVTGAAKTSYLVENGNTLVPINTDDELSLLVYHSETWMTSDDKAVTFLSDYNNKIRFRVKEDMNVILPTSSIESSSIEFKFPITFDFSEGSNCSLNFKSVDLETGTLSSISIKGLSANPTMTYIGKPLNAKSLSNVVDFIKPEEENFQIVLPGSDKSGGLSTASLVVIILCSCLLVIFIILAIIFKRRRDNNKPSKVSPILPDDT
jgi:hypothetical protein